MNSFLLRFFNFSKNYNFLIEITFQKFIGSLSLFSHFICKFIESFRIFLKVKIAVEEISREITLKIFHFEEEDLAKY